MRADQRREIVEEQRAERKESILEKRLHLSKLDDETKEVIQKKLNEKA